MGARYDDSCATVVSSSAATDQGCSSSGAVHIFERSGKTWRLEGFVKAPNAASNDYFGYSISLSADRLAVGAYGEDSCPGTDPTTTTAAIARPASTRFSRKVRRRRPRRDRANRSNRDATRARRGAFARANAI